MVMNIFKKREQSKKQIDTQPKREYNNSHIAKDGKTLLLRQTAKLEDIENSLSVSDAIYKQFYEPLFVNICEMAQCVPASESDHHSNLHGFLDHVFECVVLALRKSEGVIYGSEREDKIMRKRDVFTYAVTVGAVTHDLGKLVTDIEFYDATNQQSHCILFGPIKPGIEFIYRFYPERSYSDHRAASSSALMNVVPQKGMKWLYEDDKLFRELIHTISGDYKLAGKLGDIVREADQFSTQKNLGRTATKFASRITQPNSGLPMANTNDMSLQHAQRQQAQNNELNRAGVIASAVVDVLNRHQDFANGKSINEKGGFCWVTRDYIYMVTPKVFEIIKSTLNDNGSGIRLSMAHVCYQILFDAGFLEKINGQTSEFLTVDPEGWNKSLKFIKLKRDKIDPEFKFPEAKFDLVYSGEKEKGEEATTKQKVEEQAPNINKAQVESAKNMSNEITEGDVPKPKKDKVAVDNKNDNHKELDNNNEYVEQQNIPLPTDDDLPPEAFISDVDATCDINELIQLDQNDVDTINQKIENDHNSNINRVGELFISFLQDGLKKKSFKINKANAQLHMVNDTMLLVSPSIFKSFINSRFGEEALTQTNSKESDSFMKKIKKLQYKLFECNLHHKDISLKNILDFTVMGASRESVISGVLLKQDVLSLLTDEKFSNSKNIFLKNIVLELKL